MAQTRFPLCTLLPVPQYIYKTYWKYSWYVENLKRKKNHQLPKQHVWHRLGPLFIRTLHTSRPSNPSSSLCGTVDVVMRLTGSWIKCQMPLCRLYVRHSISIFPSIIWLNWIAFLPSFVSHYAMLLCLFQENFFFHVQGYHSWGHE